MIFSFDCSFSWNAVIHRTIAAIAWDNLSEKAKNTFLQDNKACDLVYQHTDFVEAAVWLDVIKSFGIHWYDNLHYIDKPFSFDNTEQPKIFTPNALSAIYDAKNILRQKRSRPIDRCFAWRMLIHVIADVHQPLHSSTLVSKEHPDGDKGGNLFRLNSKYEVNNLHEYWDSAGGVFLNGSLKPAILSSIIQKEKPCDSIEILNNDPKLWVKESYEIAISYAYPKTKDFDLLYQRQVRSISLQQIAKAGCRLGSFLNKSVL